MANVFIQKDRNVIPNFRTFKETIRLGELNNAKSDLNTSWNKNIDKNLLDWKKNKSVGMAGDLLGSAFIAGSIDIEPVKKAAKYILDNRNDASLSQIDLANRIIENQNAEKEDEPPSRISSFIEVNTKELIYAHIKKLKGILLRFAYNPIIYVELARLYSILGQREKGLRNIYIAVNLAPENRYVLRSFIRLLVHYDKKENALNYLRKNSITREDPWLLSAEIGLSTLLGHDSHLVKSGLAIIKSNKYSPFSLSELKSSIATIELIEGRRRKSRDLFKSALIQPNDNSVAQIEWALSRDRLFDFNVTELNIKRNYEALSLDAFEKQDWDKAMEFTEKWFMDMPFSKRPIIMGGHISSIINDNQDQAILFYRAGLMSHPKDPQLINNLAYSLALNNRTNEALQLVNDALNLNIEEPSSKVCLTATLGLIKFRQGEIDPGRIYYLEAIEAAKKIPNIAYLQLAMINYAREELLAKSEYADVVMQRIIRFKIDESNIGLKTQYDKVLDLFKKNNLEKT